MALETGYTDNRRIAVTNRMLNYLLAVLAVPATDVFGQRAMMQYGAGTEFLFKADDSGKLALNSEQRRDNPAEVSAAKEKSRQYGTSRFCRGLGKENVTDE